MLTAGRGGAGCPSSQGTSLHADRAWGFTSVTSLTVYVLVGALRRCGGHGLVDPKRQGCSAHAGFASYLEREWG